MNLRLKVGRVKCRTRKRDCCLFAAQKNVKKTRKCRSKWHFFSDRRQESAAKHTNRLARFEQEARAVRTLDRPNALAIYDVRDDR